MREFKVGKVTLLNCDCMAYMAAQPDNAFDLAVVDVPYGIGECGKTNASRGKLAVAKNYKPFPGEDKEPPPLDYFQELFRISKHQIIWGGNHLADLINRKSSCWLVWDKLNGKTDFADCELAYTSFKTAVRIFKFQWQGMLQGCGGNKSKNEHRIHPTQKPIALYSWILRNYAKPSQRILDTHGGSFSSAIAAHYFGCEFVGCELDPDYYRDAVERFKNETKQMTMFEGTL